MLRDSLKTLAGKIIVIILGLMGTVLIARFLGTTWRGALTIIMLPQVFFLILAPLGIDKGNVYYVGKEPGRVKDIITYSLWAGLIIGGGAFLLFFLYTFTDHFEMFSKGITDGFFIIIAGTFPFLLISGYLDAIVYGKDLIWLRALKEVSLNALMLLGIFLGFNVLNKLLLTPVGASFGVALIGCSVALILTHKYVIPLRLGKFDWTYFRKNFPFGFKNHISGAAVRLIFPVIILLCTRRLPFEQLYLRFDEIAFLSLATGLFERAMMLPRSIPFALLPKITKGDPDEAIRWTLKASRFSIVFTLIEFITLLLIIDTLTLLLFGKEFADLALPFKVLVPGAIFLSIGEVLQAGLFARGRANAIMAAGILSLATATITGYFWINSMSIFGGALAATVGCFVYALVLFVFFSLEANFKLKEMFILSRSDIVDIFGKLKNKRRGTADNE